MSNCIVICVFNNVNYVNMFYLLLESIKLYGNLKDNVDILVYTTTNFMNLIKNNRLYSKKIKFEINDSYVTIEKACKARLDIFKFKNIDNYEKILYLDTDVIIKNTITKDMNDVFDIAKDNILYVIEEGEIGDSDDSHGKTLFGDEINNYSDKSAFTSGILLFKNCSEMKYLFEKINLDTINRPHYFSCHDQPYIVYNAVKYNLFDNKILQLVAANNNNNVNSDIIIHHFPGGVGNYVRKNTIMSLFLNNLKNTNI